MNFNGNLIELTEIVWLIALTAKLEFSRFFPFFSTAVCAINSSMEWKQFGYSCNTAIRPVDGV